MAIYKLREVSIIKRGCSPRPISMWLKEDGLMWAKISDLNNYSIEKTKQFINNNWQNKGLIGNYNDLFITNSATPGIPFIQKSFNKIAYHDGFLKISPNEKFIIKKYLLYKLIIDRKKIIKKGNGAIFINLSSEILKNLEINIPSPKTQQQIIDIIKPIEELIFKTNLIINKIEKYYKSKQLLITKNNKVNNIISGISNGFAYKNEHIQENGKYKIFKIKNITDDEKFNKTNFLATNKICYGDIITGLSGTIGTVKIMNENGWVTNQRTLTLKSKYFLEIKSIIELNSSKLLQNAKGAVQKNISHFDILNLNISIHNYSKNISNFYLKLLIFINNLEKIKMNLIKILIK